MTVIDFTQAYEVKEKVINKIRNKEICIELKVPVEEISFWNQFLMHSTHSAGYFLQSEANERKRKLLAREYSVLSDLQVKALIFSDFEQSNEMKVPVSLTYEEVILLEGYLDRFEEECRVFEDVEYMNLAGKYVNTLYQVLKSQAEEFDYMTKFLMKEIIKG